MPININLVIRLILLVGNALMRHELPLGKDTKDLHRILMAIIITILLELEVGLSANDDRELKDLLRRLNKRMIDQPDLAGDEGDKEA